MNTTTARVDLTGVEASEDFVAEISLSFFLHTEIIYFYDLKKYF